jgi:hypothetical protein
MTTYTENLAVTSAAMPYGGSDSSTRNLTVGDTITASFDQEAAGSTQQGYLDTEDNNIVFTLVNCTISPTSVKNRGSFTITPTTSGSNYSCNGVLVYYLPGGHQYGGPSTNHQQAEFTISGSFTGSSGSGSGGSGSSPNMGLQVWHPSNSSLPRLDTKDKQVMHYASYSGSLAFGSSTTVSVGGGYDITNGDWGIDVTPLDYDLKVISSSNQFVVSNTHTFNVTIQWRVNIFKLNQ